MSVFMGGGVGVWCLCACHGTTGQLCDSLHPPLQEFQELNLGCQGLCDKCFTCEPSGWP